MKNSRRCSKCGGSDLARIPGRPRPRGNVQTRSALHPAARAEPPRLRQLRLPRQALPIRLDRGKSGRDARSRTAAKSRRSLRARLDASFLRPVQRVSAAHFSLARIPRRLQRPSARIRRAGSIGTGIRRRPEDNVRSPLHVLKKKRTFVDFQTTRKEFSKRTLVVKNIY